MQNVDAIHKENKNLHREVDLSKAIVIKLDRKFREQDREIIETKSCSMQNNLLIDSFKDSPKESLMMDVPNDIKRVHMV